MRYTFVVGLIVFVTQLVSGQINWSILKCPSLTHAIEVGYLDVGEAPSRVVYLTDGRKWTNLSRVIAVLDSLHSISQTYPSTRYVFISTVDPSTKIDHRDVLFKCGNEAFRTAFAQTIIPSVEADIAKEILPRNRILIGLSLGTMHAGYEATLADSPFDKFALLSPITYPCPRLSQYVAFTPVEVAEKRRVFVSTGEFDAESYAVPLAALFEGAGSETILIQTLGGHDFSNWTSQLPELFMWLNFADHE